MSKKLSFINSIGGKILVIFVAVCLIAIISVSTFSINRASSALKKNAFNQLEAVQEVKKAQIGSFFNERLGDVKVLSENDTIKKDLLAFKEAFTADGDSINGPNWQQAERNFTRFLKIYKEEYGYYDLFLIHNDGDVVYTVCKESDLGENLITGKLKDSPLGKCFQKALKDTALADFEPYAPSGGEPASFVGAPIRDQGKIIGVVALQISLDAINHIMQQRAGMGETGETYLVGPDKKMRSDSFLDPTGHSVKASFAGTIENNGVDTEATREAFAGRNNNKIIIDYNGNPVLSAWDTIDVGDTKWAVIAEIDEAEVNKPVQAITTAIILIALLVLAGVVVVAVMFSRSISKPLLTIVDAGEQITRGEFPEKDIDVKSKDEVGTITNVFNRIVTSLKKKGDELSKIANGDLTVDVEYNSKNDQFAQSFDKMVGSLNDVLGQVNSSVDQVASGSNQVSSASQSLSQGASEQASSLEEITSSITEINGQTKQNADNAMQANQLSKTSMENAESGNKQMKELVIAMEDINKSSDEIKKVVKVIDDIAFQINLLALNANVEAARAGKFGKGFAVVAEEVRNLAARSAEAVKETTTMVEASVKSIETGNQLVEATAAQLGEIVEGASKVTDLVEEIATASNEQAQGLDQVNKGLGQVDQVTQANTASAEESASASEELASQAQQLKAMVGRFKLKKNSTGSTNSVNSDMLKQIIKEEMTKSGEMSQSTIISTSPFPASSPAPTNEPVLASVDGNGKSQAPKNPKEVIKLDDDDFGKF